MEYVAIVLAILVAIYNVYDRLTRAKPPDLSPLASKSDLSKIKPGPSWEQVKDYIDEYFATQEWVKKYFAPSQGLEKIKKTVEGLRAPPPPSGSRAPMPPPGPSSEEIKILRERSSRAVMSSRELFIFVTHVIKTFQERFKAPLEAERSAIQAKLREKLTPLEEAKKAAEGRLFELRANPLHKDPTDEQLEEELRQAIKGIQGIGQRVDAQQKYLASRESKWQEYEAECALTESQVEAANLALTTFRHSEECRALEAQISELTAELKKLDVLDEEGRRVGHKLSKSAESIPPEEVDEVANSLGELRKSFVPPPPARTPSAD